MVHCGECVVWLHRQVFFCSGCASVARVGSSICNSGKNSSRSQVSGLSVINSIFGTTGNVVVWWLQRSDRWCHDVQWRVSHVSQCLLLCFRFILVFSCLVLSVFSTIPAHQDFSSNCLLILVRRDIIYMTRYNTADTVPSCSTGMCDDRGVWVGVHHPHLVGRMLLPLQRMAGTPALRPQAFLFYRWAFAFVFYLALFHFPSSRLSDGCQPGRSQGRVPRHSGLLLSFSVRSLESASHLVFHRLDVELCEL